MIQVTPDVEDMVSALKSLVRDRSSIPKVAEQIGMDYYALRNNLNGKTEMRLKTYYAIIAAINVTDEDVKQRAREFRQ